ATRKSTTTDARLDTGTRRRGKKTFWTSDWFPTIEPDARPSDPLKRFHASIPASVKRKYGMCSSPVDRSAICPNTTVKMPALTSGWAITHVMPKIVWRYRTMMSRRARRTATSRAFHSSRHDGRLRRPGGVMTVRWTLCSTSDPLVVEVHEDHALLGARL